MYEQKKLRFVVDDFISSLSQDSINQLNFLILNHQIVESWPWYEMVISRYLQGEDATGLIEEIGKLFPDESALKYIESNTDFPVFEAKIILRAAQDVLKSSHINY